MVNRLQNTRWMYPKKGVSVLARKNPHIMQCGVSLHGAFHAHGSKKKEKKRKILHYTPIMVFMLKPHILVVDMNHKNETLEVLQPFVIGSLQD